MINPLYYSKKFFLAVALSFSAITLIAADRYSVANGNWNSTSTWSLTSGGASGASVPGAADNVFIENGYTVTVTANAACTNIIFSGTGNAATLSVNSSVTLTVSGAVTLYKLPNANISCSVTGNGTLTCASLSVGSAANSPTSNNTTRTHTFNSSLAALNITGALSINSYFLATNRIRNGVFNHNSGTVTIGGSLTTTNANGSNTSTYSMEAGAQSGTLVLAGATPLNISGTGNSDFQFNGTNTLVNYNYTGAQNIYSTAYTNITFSGNGIKSIPSGVSITGILSMEGTATASGTTPSFGAAATLQYKGAAAQTSGIEVPSSVPNLIIDNGSGLTLSGNITAANRITMSNGNITTGVNTLILTDGGPASLVRTSGSVIGKFRRAVTSTGADYIFPVGIIGNYRPAVMNFSALSASTNITSEFINSPPIGFSPYSDDISYVSTTFTEGYWRFSSSGLPTAIYSLKLTGSGFVSYPINQLTRITGRDNTNSTWRAIGVHDTWSGSDVSRNEVTNLNTTSFDFAIASGCNSTLLGYGYERNITIDYTKVAGGINLFSFPVMIYINGQDYLRTSPDGQILNANGYDIIFSDNNYNKLDHQVEYYNGTTGDLIAWVRIPVLSATSNTVIKMLYGNNQISTNPSVTTVWDSHYKGVWHLNDNNLPDVTSYNKSGTSYNTPTYPAGRINNALGMNGTNEYVQVNNASNLNFAGNITVSAWAYMDAAGRDQKIAGNQNNGSGGYKFGIYTNNKVEFEIRNSANTPSLNRDVTGGTVLSTGQWYYLAGMSSDVLDSIKTFVNGIPERPFKKVGILGIASDNMVVGKEPFLSDYYFAGRIDELRVSDKVRSNGWLRTEYNNQSSPSTFYSIASTETSTTSLPSIGLCNLPLTLTFGYPSGGTYSGNPYISGNTFNPPSAGTYSITYTYNAGCGPIMVTKNIVVTGIPPAPTAPDKDYCVSQITYLEAVTGSNLRWYYGGLQVSNANPFSTGQTAAASYTYTVTQTLNGCESAPATVILNIFNGITINTQPQPQTICAGNNAVFSVAATGLNLTYRWQEAGVNISDGGIYSGATTATLILTNPGIAKNGRQFRCVISTTCGSPVNSSAALLTVNTPQVATFSYTGTPYCPNAANPLPAFSGGGVAGTFSSTAGLVFVSTSTGQVNLAASIPGTYTVTNTIPAAGGCAVVTATSPLTITLTQSWTGASGTNWNSTGNWNCGLIPSTTISAVIPNVANKPVLSGGSIGTVNNLTIDAGSSLTVSGNTLRVAGTITSNGTFTSTAGTIEMNGTSAQTIGNNVFSSNTVNNLIINNPAGVTLSGPLNISGTLLVSSGTLASDGNLTLVSTSSQTALINGTGSGNVTGNVIMQRYLPSAYGYKYYSSPFQSATVNEFSDEVSLAASFPVIYSYDENRISSGWVSYINPANTLNPLHGYAVNFGSAGTPLTTDITGVVGNGAMSATLYNHNNTYTLGFNLIGNPYPSPIDWNIASGWTKTNIDNALYYFKASTTDEYGGTYSSYINGVSSDGLATAVIPSMQGFFVHVSNGSFPVTATLSINNNSRVTDLTHAFIKSDDKSSVPLIRLTASFYGDTVSKDYAVMYFDEKGSNGFDPQLDALKLMNTDLAVPDLYFPGSDGTRLSINSLQESTDTLQVIPLGVKVNMDGYVVFRISDVSEEFSGKKIYISDAVTASSQSLLQDKTYKVYLDEGEYKNRFLLNLSSGVTEIPDIHDNNELFSVYSTKGVLKAFVNTDITGVGKLSVMSVTGQVLFVERISDPGYNEFYPDIKNGIYIVTFESETYRFSKKLFISNK